MSSFGRWTRVDGLPAFSYTADPANTEWDRVIDPPTRRHWVHCGNRRITLVADNEGLSGLWDEHTGCRWITEPAPHGTGTSRLEGTGAPLSTDAGQGIIDRTFGPVFSHVRAANEDATVERGVLCPEGAAPWVLIRIVVTNRTRKSVHWTLTEEWAVRPRIVNMDFGPSGQASPTDSGEQNAVPVILERLDDKASVRWSDSGQAMLELTAPVELPPGGRLTLWFRFGLDDGPVGAEPAVLYEKSLAALRERLPSAAAERYPQAAAEIPWHTAMLTGGSCADGVLGGHTLDQGSAYSFRHGFNGAARDPLQHALPLVYIEPDLALDVLRNTCSWGSPDGDLPYALDGLKQPVTGLFRPSDQNLWALWLAAEYAAATGDLGAFAEHVPYHPCHDAPPVPLEENLRRQFRFFAEVVGLGENGHVRILNADWNDLVLDQFGVDREAMIERGESVLNSAMAAWVLPVYAGLADRLGDGVTARAARSLATGLRERVAADWNGRWFRRAYAPGAGPIGDDILWLEVQPWAILCGAATPGQARVLLSTIDEICRAGSPLGARVRGTTDGVGGIWYSINMTLIWAAAAYDPTLAWDEWRRMTLHNHAGAYPGIWEGTLSGPDAYLTPESERPGHTWAVPDLGVAMQAYPVANLHSHAQPLLAFLRLLGVEPTADGQLRIGPRAGDDSARFESRVLTVNPDGSGRLRTAGSVEIRTPGRMVSGTGELTW